MERTLQTKVWRARNVLQCFERRCDVSETLGRGTHNRDDVSHNPFASISPTAAYSFVRYDGTFPK